MIDEPAIGQDEEQARAFFTIANGQRLDAEKLAVSLSVSDKSVVQTESIEVRILGPEVVFGAVSSLFFNQDGEILAELMIKNLGNPDPASPEMWGVLDWSLLLRLSTQIDPTILRARAISLDADVLYTKKGARCVQGTMIDSPERQRIEAGFATHAKGFWSNPMTAIRQYFKNLRQLSSLTEDEQRFLRTNWGMLQTAASMDGIFEQEPIELFCKATYEPFPVVVAFDQEEVWRWRGAELDSIRDFEEEFDLVVRDILLQRKAEIASELQNLTSEERRETEDKLRLIEQYLEDPQALPEEDLEFFENALGNVRQDIYNSIWQKAREIDLAENGGETLPLAQLPEYEMQDVYHITLGWVLWEVYLQLRPQMTRAERRLFMALYLPNPYLAGRIAAIDQTFVDFILCASEEVLGVTVLVLAAGVKKIGELDLAAEFTEYWQTWLWLCDLVRSNSVGKLSQVLGQKPWRPRQFMSRPVIEVSLNSQGETSDLAEKLTASSSTSGIALEERVEAGLEDRVLRHVVDHRAILARLINQYATPHQRNVLVQKYFVSDGKEPTQIEIAKDLGISQPAVSQLIRAGLEAVRQGMREEQSAGMVNWRELLDVEFKS